MILMVKVQLIEGPGIGGRGHGGLCDAGHLEAITFKSQQIG